MKKLLEGVKVGDPFLLTKPGRAHTMPVRVKRIQDGIVAVEPDLPPEQHAVLVQMTTMLTGDEEPEGGVEWTFDKSTGEGEETIEGERWQLLPVKAEAKKEV